MVPVVLATESATSQNFVAFPNPCNESLILKGLEPIDHLRAIDMQGKSINLTFEQGKVDMSSLTKGLYVIEALSNGKPNYVRILKQ
jgi:hypothetical protein